jgi:hypothetical protein
MEEMNPMDPISASGLRLLSGVLLCAAALLLGRTIALPDSGLYLAGLVACMTMVTTGLLLMDVELHRIPGFALCTLGIVSAMRAPDHTTAGTSVLESLGCAALLATGLLIAMKP